ncbi:unnamed protein product [Phytophthora fragariaefolia]|uniref:Unnamed protein product n=1 Tax=Phytophthora fragariaefolia TaxID=1490495 RepID=A0A9W6Y4U5_9STRA|nr:unnamed protein product [Phytophthora fragariaefolia]
MSKNGLLRLVTCVYYLNDAWEPGHGGELRVHLKDSEFLPGCHWDVPPELDTLVMFRSLDVEHEVLPTFRERKAVTIWYYGNPPKSSSFRSKPEGGTTDAVLRPLPSASGKQLSHAEQASIFVAIPSYRDPECRHTLDNLLAQAAFPARVSVGICLQVDDADDTKAYIEHKYTTAQVRVHQVDYRIAAGPCVARAQAQQLYEGEEYYLQVDSHMRFRPGWDCFLINELGKCPGTKPILTTPPSSLFWAAGFAFSSATVIKDVPYDESLRFLFFGEESSMAARLWTSGWNFFAPAEAVVYHLWTRAYRPVFQELEDEKTKQWRTASSQYVKQLLHVGPTAENSANTVSAGKYALGTERSFESYQKHIGVNFTTREIEWRAEWGNLDPIHFDLKAHAGKTLTPA